jgi:hypothetical protein
MTNSFIAMFAKSAVYERKADTKTSKRPKLREVV